jgi:hypothetical protein
MENFAADFIVLEFSKRQRRDIFAVTNPVVGVSSLQVHCVSSKKVFQSTGKPLATISFVIPDENVLISKASINHDREKEKITIACTAENKKMIKWHVKLSKIWGASHGMILGETILDRHDQIGAVVREKTIALQIKGF